MSDFKRLKVWRKAHALTLNVHRLCGQLRGPQNAALRNQITRSAMSISANIVEGRAQASERDFARFLRYALASSVELEYHLILARDTRAMRAADVHGLLSQLIEVRKMLHGLLATLAAKKV